MLKGNIKLKFLKRRKKLALIIFIICFCCLIFLDRVLELNFFADSLGFIFLPVEKFCIETFNWSQKKIIFLNNIFEIENENIRLKEEAEKNNFERQRCKILEQENQKLNALLEMKNKFNDYDLVGANVIAKDSGGWFDIFLIDKGLNDGIKNNMVVLAKNGLAGKIIDCQKNFSKVLSLIDEKNSVSIKNSRTDDLGFVKGNLKFKSQGLCIVEFLDENADLIEGDEIVTSHLSEIYPKRLLVGQIKKINLDNNEKEIILEPASDFKNIEHVLIIKQQQKNLEE